MYTLYGWPIDYNPCDVTVEDIYLGEFETYEEAVAKGKELVDKKEIACFDIYD